MNFNEITEFETAQLSENFLGNHILKYSFFHLLSEFVDWWEWVAIRKELEVLNINFKEHIIANNFKRKYAFC